MTIWDGPGDPRLNPNPTLPEAGFNVGQPFFVLFSRSGRVEPDPKDLGRDGLAGRAGSCTPLGVGI